MAIPRTPKTPKSDKMGQNGPKTAFWRGFGGYYILAGSDLVHLLTWDMRYPSRWGISRDRGVAQTYEFLLADFGLHLYIGRTPVATRKWPKSRKFPSKCPKLIGAGIMVIGNFMKCWKSRKCRNGKMRNPGSQRCVRHKGNPDIGKVEKCNFCQF
jgi:hypothetical protein